MPYLKQTRQLQSFFCIGVLIRAHNVNDVAIEYFKKALEAAKKLTKEFYYEVEATCNLALAIRECGGFNEALTDFEKALELSTIKEDQDRQTICLDYLLETLLKIANNVFIIFYLV
jgi:tetratricopeptide (TPR) repeat protein